MGHASLFLSFFSPRPSPGMPVHDALRSGSSTAPPGTCEVIHSLLSTVFLLIPIDSVYLSHFSPFLLSFLLPGCCSAGACCLLALAEGVFPCSFRILPDCVMQRLLWVGYFDNTDGTRFCCPETDVRACAVLWLFAVILAVHSICDALSDYR